MGVRSPNGTSKTSRLLPFASQPAPAGRRRIHSSVSLLPMAKRTRDEPEHADVVQCVLQAYALLGKTGKPVLKQRTVLAGVVVCREGFQPRLVSLATGTKCLPASARCSRGSKVNDSHAEVLARRCALRGLHTELRDSLRADADDSESRAVQLWTKPVSSLLALSACLPASRPLGAGSETEHTPLPYFELARTNPARAAQQ